MSPWNNPALVFDESGRSATLIEQLTYRHPSGLFKVPIGFSTDFASIPRIFQRILPKLDRHIRAAILHDWLYLAGEDTRQHADGIFLDGMRDLGVSWLKRRTIYSATRAFGWIAWNRHRKRQG